MVNLYKIILYEIEKLKMFLENKYTQLYFKIINLAINRNHIKNVMMVTNGIM
jgi:hypothetical protein